MFEFAMRSELLILAVLTHGGLSVRLAEESVKAASYGHNFAVIFPGNSDQSDEKPTISVTLMNPNDAKKASVTLEYTEIHHDHSKRNRRITESVDAMYYKTIQFNKSSLSSCNSSKIANLVECSDSRINISSSDVPITVLAHWYLPGAGDSFLVFPSSMASNKYLFSTPSPASNGVTTAYFLPLSNSTTINVAGKINGQQFNNSFDPVSDKGNLMAVQATGNLTLEASAKSPFTVIITVEHLPISMNDSRTDFGAFMPTPLLDSACGGSLDYHVSMLYGTKTFLVTNDLSCHTQFDVFEEKSLPTLYSQSDTCQKVEFEEFSENAGFNSSSAMLQVLRYGGYGLNELINGSFLDLDVSWSQFVTGLTTIFIPTDENIVTIIGDGDAKASTIIGDSFPTEMIWNWVPIPFYQKVFYYSSTSLPRGFYSITSDGFYTVFVRGKNHSAAYGFVTAYNNQKSKGLPAIKTTTAQPRTTTRPLSSTTTMKPSTTLSSTTTMKSSTTSSSITPTESSTTSVIWTTSERTSGSAKTSSILTLLISANIFWLTH